MKKQNKKKILRDLESKMIANATKRTDLNLDPYWQQRLRQKKLLKNYLRRFNGDLLPGRLVSISEAMYNDLKIYCPEALLLIDDLGYNIQLQIKKL